MRQQNPRLNILTENDVTVVELTDRKILDEVGITQIGDRLNRVVAESELPRLVLDFSGVIHMSSSALGMLITLHKRVREKKGQLRLCCIQESIYEVFVITRLNEIFAIDETRRQAVEQLQ